MRHLFDLENWVIDPMRIILVDKGNKQLYYETSDKILTIDLTDNDIDSLMEDLHEQFVPDCENDTRESD